MQILKAYRHGELALRGAGERDHLLELCLREAGRGNVPAMRTLVRRYGYPESDIQEQLDALRSLKGKQMKLSL